MYLKSSTITFTFFLWSPHAAQMFPHVSCCLLASSLPAGVMTWEPCPQVSRDYSAPHCSGSVLLPLFQKGMQSHLQLRPEGTKPRKPGTGGQWAKTPEWWTRKLAKRVGWPPKKEDFVHISRGRLGSQETFLAMLPKILHTHSQTDSSSLS